MNSTPRSVIVKLLLISVLFFSCDKKEDEGNGWESCLDCTVQSWLGNFSGLGEYKHLNSGNVVSGVQVSVEIVEISENYIQVKIQSPNYYSATIYGNFVGSYSISIASSTKSFSGSLQKKENTLKLIGEAKEYVEKVNGIEVVKRIVFEASKD
ncbi:MAG: hypothetical protein K9G76_10980 [Bacteroidales bacterium]|nr:hypothetical protein [Bacteroidales bacterium]MCF8404916.1 hypothetical protein [Bacteroidales bacterium]